MAPKAMVTCEGRGQTMAEPDEGGLYWRIDTGSSAEARNLSARLRRDKSVTDVKQRGKTVWVRTSGPDVGEKPTPDAVSAKRIDFNLA